jgi:hypothetical protein
MEGPVGCAEAHRSRLRGRFPLPIVEIGPAPPVVF